MSQSRARLSLAHQWLLIAVATLVPLLSVVGYASWSLYNQMHTQRGIVHAVDVVSHVHLRLVDQSRELERFMRQYRLLGDPHFQVLFEEKLEEFSSTGVELGLLAPMGDLIPEAQLEQPHPLRLSLDRHRAVLTTFEGRALSDYEDEAFAEAIAEVGSFRSLLNHQVGVHVQNLIEEGDSQLQAVLARLAFAGLVTLPLTLVLMALGFWQMIRPVRRLSRAIRGLGEGDWQQPIAVRGPKDLELLGERLEWLREQLQAAEQQKQAFSRHVSHELKTPLACIVEAGSLLQEEVPGPINERQRQVLAILQDNTTSLADLIQQLLNYNVISHSFESQAQSVALTTIIQPVIMRLEKGYPGHRVQWCLAVEEQPINSDPRLLEMIVSNLLSNAFHFSPEGAAIDVHWQLLEAGACLRVRDRGPGIPEAERVRIFEPFVQGATRRQGATKGSGVGLAIVREAVAGLNGRITLASPPDGGSEFTVEIPYA